MNRFRAAGTSFFVVALILILSRRTTFGRESFTWEGSTSHSVAQDDSPISGPDPEPIKPSTVAVTPERVKSSAEPYSTQFVIGKLRKEELGWLSEAMPNANTSIYVVDDDADKLRIPKNKGREAMVYLTYIIDNYDHLPDISIFFHPHDFVWHNNDLMGYNTGNMLKNLNLDHVNRVGYFPLRCHHDPGCPNWLHLDLPEADLDPFLRKEEKYFTSKTWKQVHPTRPLPSAISAPCCAQFAVTRERIHSNPVAEYLRLRNWLLHTDLDDQISGRWFEYSWHIIFTGEYEFCPSQSVCYCDGYGICFGGDLEFQHWLDRREMASYYRMQADRLEEKKEDKDRMKSLRKQAEAIDRWLSTTHEQAKERGKDPKLRAEDCGRNWQEGDGF